MGESRICSHRPLVKPGIPTSPISLQSGQREEKLHSGFELTGSTDGAPKHGDVPATSKGKGRARDKVPDIADRSTGTRPKAQPGSPKLRDDADGDITDTTFYSAVSVFWPIP